MSGGIAQLVAVGAQDVHLVGQPEVSFFRSTYKRHTNFSQTVERQVIQGNVSNGGMSTVRFERKGDMLGYVYLMPIKGDGTSANAFTDWKTVLSKLELLVGLLDKSESMIFALNDETSQNDQSLQSMKDLIPSTMDKLHELSNKAGGLIGSSTGFKDLDTKLQGIQDGDLVVVAGRPSMGKTSLAMNIAENVLLGKDNEGAVLIFSLEMPGEALTTRMLSGMCKLNQQNVRSGMLKDNELKLLLQEGERLKNLPLWIDDSSLLSPMELRAKARRLARQEENGLSLIVVDYLQLMQLPTSTENRVNQISEISRSLKSLAKELNVPVIALSQLNRAVEQRPNKRPIMADFTMWKNSLLILLMRPGR